MKTVDNKKAYFSLAAGIFAFLNLFIWYLSIPMAMLAIVLGIFALRDRNVQKKDFGIAGIVVGSVMLCATIGLHIVALSLFQKDQSDWIKNYLASPSAVTAAPTPEFPTKQDTDITGKI